MRPEALRAAVLAIWKQEGRVDLVPVRGGSMRPLLREGDRVVVRFGAPHRLRFGEVVVFERDGGIVVHRVLARRTVAGVPRILERGDAGAAATWIASASIAGVVIGLEREGNDRRALEGTAGRWRRALRSFAVAALLRTGWRRRRARPARAASAAGDAALPVALRDSALEFLVRGALGLGWEEPDPAPTPEQWRQLLALAERHRVGALLWNGLSQRTSAAPLPPEVAEALRKQALGAAARSARWLAEELQVGEELDRLGIEWMVLKGAPMAERLYGSAALRPSDDLDLLIHEEDVERAVAALEARGYVPREQATASRRRAWHHQVILDRAAAGGSLCLELHWTLTDRFGLVWPDEAAVWRRSSSHRMDAVDEALFLAVHLDKHGLLNRVLLPGDDPAWARRFLLHPRSENRLLWFADLWRALDGVAKAGALEELADRARQWNATAALASCRVALDRLSSGAMPAAWRDLGPLDGARRRGARVRYRLVMGGALPYLPPAQGRKPWLLERGGVSGFRPLRLADALRYAVPPASYLRARYSRDGGRAPMRWLRHLGSVVAEMVHLLS